MRHSIRNTAQYSNFTRGPLTSETYEAMQEILDEIRAGKFAHKWMRDMVN